MKKRCLILGSLAFASLICRSQVNDTAQNKVSKTDIEILYNHYLQDGNNSAVTGGIGTEKLTVYSPSFSIKTGNGKNTFVIKAGADIISSASTDNIDFIVSSASVLDARSYANINYARKIEKKNTTVNAGTGFSIESDYFSLPVNFGINHTNKAGLHTLSADVNMNFDDLRWGRLNPGVFKPVKLIYPAELRFREWFTEYKRNSYNLKFGFIQTINQRNIIGIFPEFSLQKGLLSTPFHRVYFADGFLAVENLPSTRKKAALALKWNRFTGGRIILKNTLNGYIDDFGILGFAIENETAIKLNAKFTLSPNARFYVQKGSKFFAPFKQHESGKAFYTSDYDLSAFTSYQAGIAFKYHPNVYISKKLMFKNLSFRYSYYRRSNTLYAHILSLSMDFSSTSSKTPLRGRGGKVKPSISQ